MKTLLFLPFLLFFSGHDLNAAELVVYSSRKEKFTRPLLDQFQKDTGIRVKLLSPVKVVKILEEQRRPLGNIFISNDVGQLEFLRLKGALRSVDIKGNFGISSNFRASDNSWIGISARSRILIYNQNSIASEDMPQTLWELTDPKWKGQFAITRGGNSSMIAHVAALTSQWGEEKTLEWLGKIKNNAGAITKGHTEIRQAVGRGEFKFGLVNNYYYHLQKMEKKHNRVAAVYPDQKGMGVFTNSAGVAMLANSKNQSQAEAFMRWVVRPGSQKLFIQASREVPLNPAIPGPREGKEIDQYKVMTVSLESLGKYWPQSKKIIQRAGLDLTLK